MVVRKFGWSRLAVCLLAGLLVIAAGMSGVAKAGGYSGSLICGNCHDDKYETFMRHGHPWMEMATNREDPKDGKFPSWAEGYPTGESVPATIPDADLYADDWNGKTGTVVRKLAWKDVVSIFGGWEGGGDLLIDPQDLRHLSGRYVGAVNTSGTPTKVYRTYAGKPTATSTDNQFPFRCFNCHNTGCTTGSPVGAFGTTLPYTYGTTPMGTPMAGIQCEQCHGPSAMTLPQKDSDGLDICTKCHSRTDAPDKAIPVDLVNMYYTDRHCQGDENRQSPHKKYGCLLCHDPHKSTAQGDGGLKYVESLEEYGNQCKHCHDQKIRGGMGEIGMECTDCHMPRLSEMGALITHLFRINPEPLTLADVTEVGAIHNGSKGNFLKTDENGEASLTLDLVCNQCHDNMDIQQLSTKAKAIHREPNVVDLTVNGFDTMQIVTTKQAIKVALSVKPGEDTPTGKVNWSVLRQGPKGWSYFDGKAWKSGNKPWLKSTAIKETQKVVFNGKLTDKGYNTYWASIGDFHDSVPVRVK